MAFAFAFGPRLGFKVISNPLTWPLPLLASPVASWGRSFGHQSLLNLGAGNVIFKAPLTKYFMAGSQVNNSTLGYRCFIESHRDPFWALPVLWRPAQGPNKKIDRQG